jgi:hypothetical protein
MMCLPSPGEGEERCPFCGSGRQELGFLLSLFPVKAVVCALLTKNSNQTKIASERSDSYL